MHTLKAFGLQERAIDIDDISLCMRICMRMQLRFEFASGHRAEYVANAPAWAQAKGRARVQQSTAALR
jgi:hypothetical protein